MTAFIQLTTPPRLATPHPIPDPQTPGPSPPNGGEERKNRVNSLAPSGGEGGRRPGEGARFGPVDPRDSGGGAPRAQLFSNQSKLRRKIQVYATGCLPGLHLRGHAVGVNRS